MQQALDPLSLDPLPVPDTPTTVRAPASVDPAAPAGTPTRRRLLRAAATAAAGLLMLGTAAACGGDEDEDEDD